MTVQSVSRESTPDKIISSISQIRTKYSAFCTTCNRASIEGLERHSQKLSEGTPALRDEAAFFREMKKMHAKFVNEAYSQRLFTITGGTFCLSANLSYLVTE